jgi:hypothetical protein
LKDEVLVFAYFKGHGDGLHLAWSNDGYLWKALNNDSIFLKPAIGKEKIFRDPCLIYGHDKTFHLVWTVGWNEKGIGYSTSTDLIHWTNQQYLPIMEHEEKARNCWAPEIFYHDVTGDYIIYWSTTIEGRFPETQAFGDDGYNHRIYFVTTKDFRSFSETRLFYDNGFNVIDANILKDNGHYILFMKDETLIPPKKNIRVAVGKDLFNFGDAGEPITENHFWAEGPTGIRIQDQLIVYLDKYKINEIGAIASKDLETWRDISHEVKFPLGAQHGFVFRAPADVVAKLLVV